MPIEKY